jgi:hypothetical protein
MALFCLNLHLLHFTQLPILSYIIQIKRRNKTSEVPFQQYYLSKVSSFTQAVFLNSSDKSIFVRETKSG